MDSRMLDLYSLLAVQAQPLINALQVYTADCRRLYRELRALHPVDVTFVSEIPAEHICKLHQYLVSERVSVDIIYLGEVSRTYKKGCPYLTVQSARLYIIKKCVEVRQRCDSIYAVLNAEVYDCSGYVCRKRSLILYV